MNEVHEPEDIDDILEGDGFLPAPTVEVREDSQQIMIDTAYELGQLNIGSDGFLAATGLDLRNILSEPDNVIGRAWREGRLELTKKVANAMIDKVEDELSPTALLELLRVLEPESWDKQSANTEQTAEVEIDNGKLRLTLNRAAQSDKGRADLRKLCSNFPLYEPKVINEGNND